jgi:hypothetical protein
MIEVNGRVGASATFDGQTLNLRRTGYSRGVTGKGERRVHVSQISAVEWKPAGRLIDGFIRFVVAGTVARRSKFGQQSNDARFDEWAVPFWRKNQPEFERLRAAVEDAMAQSRASGSVPAPPDSLDQLRKLGELRDSGIVTEAEFDAKKRQILDS